MTWANLSRLKKERIQPVKEHFSGFFPAFPKTQVPRFQRLELTFRINSNKLAPGKASFDTNIAVRAS